MHSHSISYLELYSTEKDQAYNGATLHVVYPVLSVPCFLIPGPWFNIKISSQCRKSHCGDKTVVRSSYLHNGNSYTGKTTSLYWIKGPGDLRSPVISRDDVDPISWKIPSSASEELTLEMALKFLLAVLTLNVQGPSYLGLTRSISWLLMPWLLTSPTSPGRQQQWYWQCRKCRSWSYLRKDFKYMCHINVE